MVESHRDALYLGSPVRRIACVIPGDVQSLLPEHVTKVPLLDMTGHDSMHGYGDLSSECQQGSYAMVSRDVFPPLAGMQRHRLQSQRRLDTFPSDLLLLWTLSRMC